jgi:hypothetical protein
MMVSISRHYIDAKLVGKRHNLPFFFLRIKNTEETELFNPSKP